MSAKAKKLLIFNLPYVILGFIATKLGQAWRLAAGADIGEKILNLVASLGVAFKSPLPSFHPTDLLIGFAVAAAIRLYVYCKARNAKKYRKNVEYGSARWGTREDIQPYSRQNNRALLA